MFGGNFAPRGWALCNGQLLAISQNTALFSLLGTIYGGDGRTTFALPDLRGRAAIGQGHGPGLTSRSLGSRGGQENETLTTLQMPQHNHTATISGGSSGSGGNVQLSQDEAVNVSPQAGDVPAKAVQVDGLRKRDVRAYGPASNTVNGQALPSGNGGGTVNVGLNGGSQSHNNMPPYIGMNYIIALTGVYPSRN